MKKYKISILFLLTLFLLTPVISVYSATLENPTSIGINAYHKDTQSDGSPWGSYYQMNYDDDTGQNFLTYWYNDRSQSFGGDFSDGEYKILPSVGFVPSSIAGTIIPIMYNSGGNTIFTIKSYSSISDRLETLSSTTLTGNIVDGSPICYMDSTNNYYVATWDSSIARVYEIDYVSGALSEDNFYNTSEASIVFLSCFDSGLDGLNNNEMISISGYDELGLIYDNGTEIFPMTANAYASDLSEITLAVDLGNTGNELLCNDQVCINHTGGEVYDLADASLEVIVPFKPYVNDYVINAHIGDFTDKISFRDETGSEIGSLLSVNNPLDNIYGAFATDVSGGSDEELCLIGLRDSNNSETQLYCIDETGSEVLNLTTETPAICQGGITSEISDNGGAIVINHRDGILSIVNGYCVWIVDLVSSDFEYSFSMQDIFGVAPFHENYQMITDVDCDGLPDIIGLKSDDNIYYSVSSDGSSGCLIDEDSIFGVDDPIDSNTEPYMNWYFTDAEDVTQTNSTVAFAGEIIDDDADPIAQKFSCGGGIAYKDDNLYTPNPANDDWYYEACAFDGFCLTDWACEFTSEGNYTVRWSLAQRTYDSSLGLYVTDESRQQHTTWLIVVLDNGTLVEGVSVIGDNAENFLPNWKTFTQDFTEPILTNTIGTFGAILEDEEQDQIWEQFQCGGGLIMSMGIETGSDNIFIPDPFTNGWDNEPNCDDGSCIRVWGCNWTSPGTYNVTWRLSDDQHQFNGVTGINYYVEKIIEVVVSNGGTAGNTTLIDWTEPDPTIVNNIRDKNDPDLSDNLLTNYIDGLANITGTGRTIVWFAHMILFALAIWLGTRKEDNSIVAGIIMIVELLMFIVGTIMKYIHPGIVVVITICALGILAVYIKNTFFGGD